MKRKKKRILGAVVGSFLVLLVFSGLCSWFVWDHYYDGLFKKKIFQAVLLGNFMTSGLGSIMVAIAKWS
jgi:hypothetical protein